MSVENPTVVNGTKPLNENIKIDSKFRVIWRRFKKNKLGVIGLIVFCLFVLIALFAPWISPHKADTFNLMDSELGPSWSHPFGTDSDGGDIMSRAFYGARVSLTVSLSAMVLTVAFGVAYGAISGYFGGFVDNVLMRIVDAIQSIPSFFLLLMIAAIMTPSVWTTVFAISVVGWTGMARLVRSEILSLKRRDYVEAARASGEKKPSIIFIHIIPNILGPIIVLCTMEMASNIIYEASLSFLGLGIQPPTPSWGNMLTAAQDLTTLEMHPWIAIFPGLFTILCTLSINFIGDGLRDALDPKMKQ